MLTRTHEDAIMETPTTSTNIEQLYTDYYQPILRHLERLVGNRETAEDLAHETFIKALRYWAQLNQTASARKWLYRIATNTAYDYLRRKRRVKMTPLADEHALIFVAPALEIRFDEAEPIQAAFERLPEHYRLPLVLSSAGYDRELGAQRRMLGRVVGQPVSEHVQARCDGAQFLLVGGDRAARSWCRLRMACDLGLHLLDGLDRFGERCAAAISPGISNRGHRLRSAAHSRAGLARPGCAARLHW